MRYSEVGFRGVNHQYVCFPIHVFRELVKEFPGNLKSDCVLTYGYVDHEEGVSFEVLACGKKDGTKYNFYHGNPDVHMVGRIADVEDVSFEILDAYATAIPEIFAEKVERILEFQENYDLMNMRIAQEFDPFRDSHKVDEVSVLLTKEGMTSETRKARLEMKGIGSVIATLLEEPEQDFGYHEGDPIGVFVQESDPRVCVADLDRELILTRSQLADGSVLKRAIANFNKAPSDESMKHVLAILRDSDLWVPSKSEDENTVDPDYMSEKDSSYLPVFTQPDEMGEYGEHFTPVKESTLQIMELAQNEAHPVDAVVVNPFGDTFIIEKRFFDSLTKMGSHVK